MKGRTRASLNHADGKLRVIVDRIFPLREAAAAHEYLEDGHAIGKVVLSME